MFHFNFSKTILINIPFRGLGRKIQLKTAPKSPKGDFCCVKMLIVFAHVALR